MNPVGLIAYLCLVVILVVPFPAQAYIDPGTGSMILQMAIGAIAGALITLKLFWNQVVSFFSKGGRKTPEDREETRHE